MNRENSAIKDKTFAVSGDLNYFPESSRYPERKELKAFIEGLGGRLVSGISMKVDYLISNRSFADETSKVRFARENNILIISEYQFMRMAKGGDE